MHTHMEASGRASVAAVPAAAAPASRRGSQPPVRCSPPPRCGRPRRQKALHTQSSKQMTKPSFSLPYPDGASAPARTKVFLYFFCRNLMISNCSLEIKSCGSFELISSELTTGYEKQGQGEEDSGHQFLVEHHGASNADGMNALPTTRLDVLHCY